MAIRIIIAAWVSVAVLNFDISVFATPDSLEKYDRPGQMVSVGAHSLHIYCTGRGQPTVILESGIGGNHLDWTKVQPTIGKLTKVCSYDRTGYGWSERGPKPRTASVNAEELNRLLTQAGVTKPVVLVGHSFGGIIGLHFTATYSARVAGLILVDPMHPDQFERFKAVGVSVAASPSRAVIHSGRFVTTYGIPTPHKALAYELAMTDKARSFMLNELRNVKRSLGELRTDPPLGLPIRIMLHGNREWDRIYPDGRMEDAWISMHRSQARKLGAGDLIIVPKAGHQIALDDPQAVIEALKAMLTRVRSTQRTRTVPSKP